MFNKGALRSEWPVGGDHGAPRGHHSVDRSEAALLAGAHQLAHGRVIRGGEAGTHRGDAWDCEEELPAAQPHMILLASPRTSLQTFFYALM